MPLLLIIFSITFIGKLVSGDYNTNEEAEAFDIYQNTNNEDWVDPLDIFNYDRSTKSMYQNTRKASECGSNQCEEKLKLCEAEIEKLSQIVPSVQNVKQSSPNSNQKKVSVEDGCMQSIVYMRRFVNILLKAAKLDEEMPLDLDVDLRMSVSTDQLQILQLFGSGKGSISLQELESVLSSVLFTTRKSIFNNAIPWSAIFEFMLSKQVLVSMALCLVPMLLWRMLSGHSIIRSLFIFLAVIFMMSFVITYLQMYKQEEIKQYAILKRNPEVPVECRPTSELSWLQMFGRVMSSKLSYKSDECEKYYEAVMMDPFLKVKPTDVLSEMIGSFVLHPSENLGSAIAKFSSGILGNLPFGTNYIVLFGSFVFMIMIVFASCGGIIKLPFYLGGAELRGRRPVPSMTSERQRPQVEAKQEVRKDETLNEVMRALGSSEHGLFITNVRGIQILSSGSPRVNESIGLSEQEEPHTPGCCGDSRTQCRHYMVNTTSTEIQPISQTKPKINCKQEIGMEKSKSAERQEFAIEGGNKTSKPSSSCQILSETVEITGTPLQDKEIRTLGSEEDNKISSINSDERIQTLDSKEYNICSTSTLLLESKKK